MSYAVQGMAATFWATVPDPALVAYDVSFLVTGQLTLADVASAFAGSTGFAGRANRTVG